MAEPAASTAKLATFYGETSPGLRTLTWRDTTPVVLEHFLGMRNLLLNASEARESRRESGILILDGYIETLAHLGGRTGALIAERAR